MNHRSWIPLVAGILDVVAGVGAVFGFLVIGFIAAIVHWVPNDADEMAITIIVSFFVGMALFVLVIGVLAILGGAFTIGGGRWCWALTGAIAATVIFPPLGVPAVILTIVGENEIRGSTAGD